MAREESIIKGGKIMDERILLGSQKEVLIRAFQNQEMARSELKRVNEMILSELGIPEKDWKFWQFSQDLSKVINQKPPDPPKGDKKNDKT